jgi:hypothetical protein
MAALKRALCRWRTWESYKGDFLHSFKEWMESFQELLTQKQAHLIGWVVNHSSDRGWWGWNHSICFDWESHHLLKISMSGKGRWPTLSISTVNWMIWWTLFRR